MRLQTRKDIIVFKHKRYFSSGLKLFLMAIPFVLLVFAFSYVPLFGWVYAFFDYKPGIPLSHTPFIGFRKFVQTYNDSQDLVRVIRNTLVMSFLGILSSPLPVAFAILINEIKSSRFKKVVQTTTTLPHFISWIIVFSLAFSLFSNDGLVNSLLIKLNIPQQAIGILGNNNAVWLFQWTIGIWKGLGWSAIIYMATISGIETELYDAAKVDGAGRFKTIIHITIPGLYSTYLVLLLLGISNMLNNGFDQYFVFFNALVADRIEVLDYYVYKIGILSNDYPLSTALGMSKTLISLIFLFTANNISKFLRGERLV